MSDKEIPTWERLTAYFDGELDREERLEMEQLLFENPEYAQAFRDWKEMRAEFQSIPSRLVLGQRAPNSAENVSRSIMDRIVESVASGDVEWDSRPVDLESYYKLSENGQSDDRTEVASWKKDFRQLRPEQRMRRWNLQLGALATVAALLILAIGLSQFPTNQPVMTSEARPGTETRSDSEGSTEPAADIRSDGLAKSGAALDSGDQGADAALASDAPSAQDFREEMLREPGSRESGGADTQLAQKGGGGGQSPAPSIRLAPSQAGTQSRAFQQDSNTVESIAKAGRAQENISDGASGSSMLGGGGRAGGGLEQQLDMDSRQANDNAARQMSVADQGAASQSSASQVPSTQPPALEAPNASSGQQAILAQEFTNSGSFAPEEQGVVFFETSDLENGLQSLNRLLVSNGFSEGPLPEVKELEKEETPDEAETPAVAESQNSAVRQFVVVGEQDQVLNMLQQFSRMGNRVMYGSRMRMSLYGPAVTNAQQPPAETPSQALQPRDEGAAKNLARAQQQIPQAPTEAMTITESSLEPPFLGQQYNRIQNQIRVDSEEDLTELFQDGRATQAAKQQAVVNDAPQPLIQVHVFLQERRR